MNANFICLEDKAFYTLLDKVVEHIKQNHFVKEDGLPGVPDPRRPTLLQGLSRHLRKIPPNHTGGVYATAFRKKIYNTLRELQDDLDLWLEDHNTQRTPHREALLWPDTHANILETLP